MNIAVCRTIILIAALGAGSRDALFAHVSPASTPTPTSSPAQLDESTPVPSPTPTWPAPIVLPAPAPSAPTATPKTLTPNALHARKGPVVIAIVGDIHFEGWIRSQLFRDPGTLLAQVAPILRRADVAIGNLETAITTRGKPQPKMYTFRAPEAALLALRAAGITVASMANNHGMDFGTVGLQDTLAAAARDHFAIIGIGQNASQAYRPYTVLIRGERVSFLAATQVLDAKLRRSWTATDAKPGIASAKPPVLRRLLAAIRDTRKISDTVIVYLHWGTELVSCPTVAQKTLARQLIRAGADVVVGSHAHVLLGRGYLGRAYVDYGLGNFVFYARGGAAAQTGILTLTVRGRDTTAAEWTPAVIRSGVPYPLSGIQATLATSASERLRHCTNLAADPKILY